MEPKGTEHSKTLPRSKRYRTERSHSPFSQVLLLPFQAAKDGSPSTEEVLKNYLPGEFLPLLPREPTEADLHALIQLSKPQGGGPASRMAIF